MQKAVLLSALALGLVAAPPAHAKGGDDDRREVRRAGSCGARTSAKLELKQRDGGIEVEWEVDRNRAGETWRVTLVRDGRVLRRATARTSGRSGSFSYETRIPDLPGADRVTARAVGPRGVTCSATATLTSA